MVAYNPMSYHNGSVWPHDNALIAKGLSVVGRADLAERIFGGMFEAARLMFYKRLPELFCGFARDYNRSDPPVKYPVACSPQAWAAASFYSMLQSLLSITPDLANNSIKITRPRLPEGINNLEIHNLRVGTTTFDLNFRRAEKTVVVDVHNRRGKLDVLVKL
jgi:glycogen debranching enzyme